MKSHNSADALHCNYDRNTRQTSVNRHTLFFLVLSICLSMIHSWTIAKTSFSVKGGSRFLSSSVTMAFNNKPASRFNKPITAPSSSTTKRVTSYSSVQPRRSRDILADTASIDEKLKTPGKGLKKGAKRTTLPPMAAIAARSYVAEPIQSRPDSYSTTTREMSSLIDRVASKRQQPTSASSRIASSSATDSTVTTDTPSTSTLRTTEKPMSRAESTDKTGMYIRQWPDVFRAPTHFKRALRGLKAIKVDSSIKNARNQQRKHAAQQLDALMKGLNVPITQLVMLYQYGFRSLHPFEQTVANLTITARTKLGHPPLPDILARLQKLRAQTSRIAKDYAKRANTAATAGEAKEILAKGIEELQFLYSDEAKVVKEQEKEVKLSLDGDDEDGDASLGAAPKANEFLLEAQALADLLVFHQDLRRIPILELKRPTVVLVGAPNVGKSSLVRAISSGTPEVNDYPFTTRGVTIGHIYTSDVEESAAETPNEEAFMKQRHETKDEGLKSSKGLAAEEVEAKEEEQDEHAMSSNYIPAGKKLPFQKSSSFASSSSSSSSAFSTTTSSTTVRYQVMDTPGLLHRPDHERNEMERLTFASLAQLPTAVLFVIDPTELSGQRLSSLADQLAIRQYLKTRFPKRPWIDILSKSDIALTAEQQKMLTEAGILALDQSSPTTPSLLRVSVRTGENIALLRSEVRKLLKSLESILQTRSFATATANATTKDDDTEVQV